MITWPPFSLKSRATPRIARLSDSVAPEVKTISFAEAFIARATCSRAASTAASASQPKTWPREAGLPKTCVKYGVIASSTRGSTGVVAW